MKLRISAVWSGTALTAAAAICIAGLDAETRLSARCVRFDTETPDCNRLLG